MIKFYTYYSSENFVLEGSMLEADVRLMADLNPSIIYFI